MAQLVKANRAENIPELSGRLVFILQLKLDATNSKTNKGWLLFVLLSPNHDLYKLCQVVNNVHICDHVRHMLTAWYLRDLSAADEKSFMVSLAENVHLLYGGNFFPNVWIFTLGLFVTIQNAY